MILKHLHLWELGPKLYNNISFETLYFEDQYEYPNDIAAINISCDDVPLLNHDKFKIAKISNIEDPPDPLHGYYITVQKGYRTSIISCIYNESNDVDSPDSFNLQYIIDAPDQPRDSISFDYSGCGLFNTRDRLAGFYVDDKYNLSEGKNNNNNEEIQDSENVKYEHINYDYNKTTIFNIVFARNFKKLFKTKVPINEIIN